MKSEDRDLTTDSPVAHPTSTQAKSISSAAPGETVLGPARSTGPSSPDPVSGRPRERFTGTVTRIVTYVKSIFLSAPDEVAPILTILGVVLLGNFLYVIGVFNPNPINVVSGLGIIQHPGLFLGTFQIDPNNGITSQTLGHLAASDILHGHLPWWNPFEGLGAPLAGEMNSASLFPLTPLLIFSNGQLPFHMILEAVSGLATYRLLLRLNISRWIAVAGGCAFALNGTFSWFGHSPVNPIAFLPLLLLGIERARVAAEGKQGQRWALIAIALALSVYAGFPEGAYLDGLLAVLWAAVRCRGLDRSQLKYYLRKLLAGAGVGLLLAAPILAAFVAYLPTADIGAHATGFNHSFLPHEAVTSLLFPYAYGPIFGFTPYDKSGVLNGIWGNVGGYLSTALLLLDAVALYSRRFRSLRIVLVLWIVFALGRTFGIEPFARIFALIPLMNNVAAYRYLPASYELAAIVLAALAIDDIRRKTVPRWYILGCAILSAFIALLALYVGRRLFTYLSTAPHQHAWMFASAAWGLGLIVLLALAMLVTRGRLRLAVLLLCVVIDALVMFIVPDFSAPRQASTDVRLVAWMQSHLGTHRFFTLGPVQADYGTMFGLQEANINDTPVPKKYAHYITHTLDPNSNPIIFTGANPVTPTGPSALEEFYKNMANYEAIGVAYLIAVPNQIPATFIQQLDLRKVYSDSLVTVWALPKPRPLYSVISGNCSLSEQKISSVTVHCKNKGTIVRRELYMRGWSASSGSQAIDLRMNSNLFQSFEVGPGTAVVSFSYGPPHEGLALVAFVLGVALLLLGWRLGRRQGSAHRLGRSTPSG